MRTHWLIMLFLMGAGCKEEAPNDKSGTEEPAAPGESGSAATDVPAETADEPSKLGETPLVLFDARTGKRVIAGWSVGDETVLIEVREQANADRSIFQVDIYGSVPEKDKLDVHTCTDLKAASGGRIELLLRGDKLHVLCINPPHGDDIGWTEAVRLRYRSDAQEMQGAGSYSGEGVVDPDTIDLDEAEILDAP